MDNTDSRMIKQQACPHCSSSDAYTLYDDGHAYCYSCQAYDPPPKDNNIVRPAPIKGIVQTNFSNGEYSDIYDRKIKETTAKKYNVLVKKENYNIHQHIYKYYDNNNSHVASKIRNIEDY